MIALRMACMTLGASLLLAVPVARATVPIVAAENFYGELASRIGGDAVTVTSILSNPDQDPHSFEASPSVAKALSTARLVIQNGIDYDPWMEKLLAAAKAPGRRVITVATLMGRRAGDNPHVWYDPATLPTVANALAEQLSALDPANAAGYAARVADFKRSWAPITERIDAIRRANADIAVTATEPVFGEMARALGFKMLNERFQTAIMNETEPAATDIAAFERSLTDHKARVMFHNGQTSGGLPERMRDVAKRARVPVVAVSETMPAGISLPDWFGGTLEAVAKALAEPAS